MNVSVLGNVFCRQFLKNRQFQAKSNEINQINYKNIWFLKVIMILIMTAQVLYFNDFCEKDPHLNVIEWFLHKVLDVPHLMGNCDHANKFSRNCN